MPFYICVCWVCIVCLFFHSSDTEAIEYLYVFISNLYLNVCVFFLKKQHSTCVNMKINMLNLYRNCAYIFVVLGTLSYYTKQTLGHCYWEGCFKMVTILSVYKIQFCGFVMQWIYLLKSQYLMFFVVFVFIFYAFSMCNISLQTMVIWIWCQCYILYEMFVINNMKYCWNGFSGFVANFLNVSWSLTT